MSETVDSSSGGGVREGDSGTEVRGSARELHARRARRWTAKRLAFGVVVAVVVVFLAIKAADDLRQFTIVSLNGITLAALYFVVASGFTLIFGLMRVVNMAHGSLYLLGGYLALEMQDSWFKEDTGSGLGLSLSGEGDTTYSLLAWIIPLLLATG